MIIFSAFFGQSKEISQSETPSYFPRGPYTVSKLAGIWTVRTYRGAYKFNLLKFARRKSIMKVVLASYSATYGNSKSILVEDKLSDRYANLYPITKILNEHLAGYYSLRREIGWITLRYFNTYGPVENSKRQYASVVWRFINQYIIMKHH